VGLVDDDYRSPPLISEAQEGVLEPASDGFGVPGRLNPEFAGEPLVVDRYRSSRAAMGPNAKALLTQRYTVGTDTPMV